MITKKIAQTESLLSEVFLLIAEGKRVIIRANGNSMLPFLRHGIDSVELDAATDLKCGDVVLACIKEDTYILHRIIKIDNDRVVLMGDGNIKGCEYCKISDIKAKAVSFIKPSKKGDRRISCSSRSYLRRADLWQRLLPIRKYLLTIYKKVL